jgi:hypothetical protein
MMLRRVAMEESIVCAPPRQKILEGFVEKDAAGSRYVHGLQ